MAIPAQKPPGNPYVETDVNMEFHVASVSRFWLGRLVEIDAHWNPKSWSAQLFERELSNRSSVVRGLFYGSDLVGYLIAHVVCSEAHIVSFGLASKWRGMGGGRFLLREFLRSARLEGIEVFTLDVRVTNLRARRLYEESGFEVVAIRKNYYSDNGEDALTMRLVPSGSEPRSV